MRGEVDTTQMYYIVGRSDNNTNYYMCASPTGVVMIPLNSSQLVPVKATLSWSRNDVNIDISIRVVNSNNLPVYLTLNNGVIDGSSTVKTSLKATSNKLNSLYTGIWYSFDGLFNGSVCTSLTTIPFCTSVSSVDTLLVNMKLMFIPVNVAINESYGILSIWNKGSCRGAIGETLGLEMFESWIDAPGSNSEFKQSNCNGPYFASSSSNNCLFTSVETCTRGYIYTLTESCGSGLGNCSSGTCSVNSDPSASPVMTCENNKDEDEKGFGVLLSIIVIIVLLLITFIGIYFLFFKQSTTSGNSMSSKSNYMYTN